MWCSRGKNDRGGNRRETREAEADTNRNADDRHPRGSADKRVNRGRARVRARRPADGDCEKLVRAPREEHARGMVARMYVRCASPPRARRGARSRSRSTRFDEG